MAKDSAEQIIFEYLNTCIDSLQAEKNLFRGPVEPPAQDGENCVPDVAVFVLESGGLEPERCFDAEANLHQLRCAVQVRVRGCRNRYSVGKCLADDVHDALRLMKFGDGCHGQMNGLRQRESCPLYIGKDGAGHPEWSMNVEAFIDLLKTKEC